MTNDEVYYWDWSRALQLSYIDAPPLVAWLAKLGQEIFQASLGARFLFPFLHLGSLFFSIGTVRFLLKNHSLELQNKHVLFILLLNEAIPVFNIEGFILLPDGGLLFGISGTLYFLTRAIITAKKSIVQKKLSLACAIGAGSFLGFAALAKYHAFPIAVGFFFAILIIRGFKNSRQDFLFWTLLILSAICVSSPIFIWNYENHWASFQFQGQHGFSGFSIHLLPFFRYLLGVVFFILPWFFWLFIKQYKKSFQKNLWYKEIDLVFILPSIILILLISISALGKQALPHWITPAFFLMLPLVVCHLEEFIQLHKKTYKNLFAFSIIINLIFPSIASLPLFNRFVISIYTKISPDATPLYQAFLWADLYKMITQQTNLTLTRYHNTSVINSQQNCQSQPLLASLRWYWTAQMAFYFKNQPKVLNFDLDSSSYYTWRDKLEDYAKCSVIIIGSADQFDAKKISKILFIKKLQSFNLYPYKSLNIIYVEGTLKDKETLSNFTNLHKTIIQY